MNEPVRRPDLQVGRARRERLIAWTARAIALAAAGLLFLFVFVYRLNGAEFDHLASTIAFVLWHQHAPMGHYLFQQHNEHRIARAAPRRFSVSAC